MSTITALHQHTLDARMRAARVWFVFSCLQEGIRRARAETKAQQYEANLAAHWRG